MVIAAYRLKLIVVFGLVRQGCRVGPLLMPGCDSHDAKRYLIPVSTSELTTLLKDVVDINEYQGQDYFSHSLVL